MCMMHVHVIKYICSINLLRVYFSLENLLIPKYVRYNILYYRFCLVYHIFIMCAFSKNELIKLELEFDPNYQFIYQFNS